MPSCPVPWKEAAKDDDPDVASRSNSISSQSGFLCCVPGAIAFLWRCLRSRVWGPRCAPRQRHPSQSQAKPPTQCEHFNNPRPCLSIDSLLKTCTNLDHRIIGYHRLIDEDAGSPFVRKPLRSRAQIWRYVMDYDVALPSLPTELQQCKVGHLPDLCVAITKTTPKGRWSYTYGRRRAQPEALAHLTTDNMNSD